MRHLRSRNFIPGLTIPGLLVPALDGVATVYLSAHTIPFLPPYFRPALAIRAVGRVGLPRPQATSAPRAACKVIIAHSFAYVLEKCDNSLVYYPIPWWPLTIGGASDNAGAEYINWPSQ